MKNTFDEFFQGYLEALYFTETGDEGQPGADAELDPVFRESLKVDCAIFWKRCSPLILKEPDSPGAAHAGHDFWLTRNGHGSGFWDGDWPVNGDILTRLCDGFDAIGEIAWAESHRVGSCPYCSGTDVTGSSFSLDYFNARDIAFQTVSCSDCNREWIEEYTFTRVIHLTTEEE